MAWLADTNVLVYRADPRDPVKRSRATELLREGIASGEARLPLQAILEFVTATTRRRRDGGDPLLAMPDALREAEELLSEFDVVYPGESQTRLAIRGVATYGLAWYDAHVWACAELNGLSPLYSEDFQHGRLYGTVRVVDPFR